jgi:hypothetical protein
MMRHPFLAGLMVGLLWGLLAWPVAVMLFARTPS